MRQARILMCPADYYGIEYEINPWMSRSRGSAPERARRQWQTLHDTLAGLGVQVERLQPQPGGPARGLRANPGRASPTRSSARASRTKARPPRPPSDDAW